jgi:hypothetical protein
LTSALDGNEWLASRPGRFTPGAISHRYPLDRRLGGPRSRSGEEKNLALSGIKPRRPVRSPQLYRLSYPDLVHDDIKYFYDRHCPRPLHRILVKLGLNSIKCYNVFSNKIKPLHVSANDGHHGKVTNTSKEMLHMNYMHVLSCVGYTSA